MFLRHLAIYLLPTLAFALSTEITVLNQSATTVPPGGRIEFTLRITNTGPETWTPAPYSALEYSRPEGQVVHYFIPHPDTPLIIDPAHIGTFHLHLSLFEPSRSDYLDRYAITFLPLPHVVYPGQSIIITDYVYAPMKPGRYHIATKLSLAGCCNFVSRVLHNPFEDYTLGAPIQFDVVSDATGPATTSLTLTPIPAAVSVPVGLNAIIDDTGTGGNPILSASATVSGPGISDYVIPLNGTFGSSPIVNVSGTLQSFSQPGLYVICVRGVDNSGNSGPESCVVLPVYDPAAGFVTGGGAINSPTGADLNNPSLSGPAQFAFVSKYNKNSNTPTGNLEFQFKAGSLHFKSTAMDWLVVTGEPRAIFRGEGTINGTASCRFEVDAWDGSGPDGDDSFGLKIYSCDGGSDRYKLSPAPLMRGSIIIHKDGRPQQDGNSNLLLFEDFNDGIANDWLPLRPGWVVQDGIYKSTNTECCIAVESYYTGGGDWTNYEASTRFVMYGSYAPADAQLMFRYTPPPNVVYGVYSDNGACQVLRDYDGVRLQIVSSKQPSQFGYAAVPVSLSIGTWYTLVATIQGSLATCEIKEIPGARVGPVSGLFNDKGTIGLRGTHTPVSFDDVKVVAK